MFDPDQPFYAIIAAAIKASQESLNKISAALHQRGYSISGATLSRWASGTTEPTGKHVGVLRVLPEVLKLSPADQAAFQRALNRWLGVKADARGSAPLAYRQNTLGPLPNFVGRVAELQRLQQTIARRQSIAITGLGGMGKTTLARQVLRNCAAEFTSGCEALVLHPQQTAVGLIAQAARRLGLTPPDDIQHIDSAELLSWIDDLTIGVDLLFLLDDVSDEVQVQGLVQGLPHITWILTSRRPLKLTGVQPFPLDTLENADAAQLLLSQTGRSDLPTDLPLVCRIADRLGNLPLALNCAAGLATLHSSNWEAVWDWLDARGWQALQLDYAHLPQFFGRMLADQSTETRTLFELCGAFASLRISDSIFQPLARRLGLLPIGLLVLRNLSLLNWPEDQSFFVLHPLIHEYAALRLQGASRRTEIQQCYSVLYAELAGVWRKDQNYAVLQDELENVLTAADYAYEGQDWDCFRKFWSPITHYLWVTGDKSRYAAYDEKFLEAARLQNDRAIETTILSELAWVYQDRGDLAEADRTLEELLALCDSSLDGELQRARVFRYQAKIAIRRHDPARALNLLQDSEKIVRDQGAVAGRSALSLALIYIIRAKIAHAARQGEPAILAALTSLDFCRQAGPEHQGYLPGILVDVGDYLDEYSERDKAASYWQAAAAFDAQQVEDESIATARVRLAYLAAVRAQKDEALHHARSAHQIYVQRGTIRYQLRLGEWQRNYEDHDEIGPLLDLARLEG